ncbi:MAG: precorrin-4 C(11)-methyltransferase [Spirochaetaceae bacterium]|jgi:precorrin-4/cobalt-precorrin-4 C11-methyltransferase|nr:precorrin-4 C(11)-methyltransferase [Spirochaetaceae bacterium]
MIYFVGAGPGAPDLITLRGRELLGRADQIIYAGSLVNPALLAYAKEGCAIYNSASMTLEEVMERFAAAEDKGWMTVRLHTGDPSLYGAIREQMERLDERGFDYQVVPGVSSFCGAAAALKAEYTLPGLSQTLIITRAAGRTEVPEKEDLALLASHGSSLAIFLSAALMGELREKLLAGGYGADTPAAIVYKATWPDERVIRGTVGDLCRMREESGITKTALVLVGAFLAGSGARSRLYDGAFTHEFRQGREAP